MSRMLSTVCRQMDCVFTLGGEQESTLLVLAPQMFLPIVASVAEINAGLHGLALGSSFVEDPDSLFGLSVTVAAVQSDPASLLRALYYLDAMQQVLGVAPGANVELGPVVEQCSDGLFSAGKAGWPLSIVSFDRTGVQSAEAA